MINSNNNSYVFKSYLNVFKWVADRMQGFKCFSYAFKYFKDSTTLKNIKIIRNIITYFHSHTSHIIH